MTLEVRGVEPPDDTPKRLVAALRRRWRTTAAVMLTPFVVGWGVPAMFEPDCRGTIPRVVFLLLEGPLITSVLSWHFDRVAGRSSHDHRLLLSHGAISSVLGAACASLAWVTTSALGLDFASFQGGEPLTAPRVLAFGTVVGALQFVLWALALAYPFAVEHARLRAHESVTLRLESERLRLEAETLRLEAEKLRSSAELASLRSQLEPHFLLNTLNTIAGLVTQNPREARRLLGCVGDLLRDSLRDIDEMQPLDRELSWLRKYADILESRHSEALTFRWQIDDEARGVLLPRLLLQPLVENAVNHGALQREGGGEVSIRALIEHDSHGDLLVCTIEDNGPGMPSKDPRAGAIGLRSVRQRLALKFTNARFVVETGQKGTRAIVRWPISTRNAREKELAS